MLTSNTEISSSGLIVLHLIEFAVIYGVYRLVDNQNHIAGSVFMGLALCYVLCYTFKLAMTLIVRFAQRSN